MSKSVLAFSRVHIVGTSSLVLGSNSVVSHEWPKWNAGSWKKWFVCVNESLRKNLELQVVTYIRIRFGHSQVKYPYDKVFFPFGICHVAFPYMDPVSFLSKSVQKVVLSCSLEYFVQKTTQQSHGCCNVTCASQFLYKLFKKRTFHFCKHLWKIYSEQRTMFCSPRWQDVFPTQLYISHYTNRRQ